MEMNNFDYGDKQDNGQYENYPTITDGEYKNPVRSLYRHNRCKAITAISNEIAETYAKDPKYYSHTFCGQCRDHLPVSEFLWMDGGIVTSVVVGDIEVLAVNEDSPIVGYVMDPASSVIGDGDTVSVKFSTTNRQYYVLNDDGKVVMVCTDCMIPSDTPGYIKNTEDCLHKTRE